MAASASRSLRAASALAVVALLVASAPPAAYAEFFAAPRPAGGPALRISVTDGAAPLVGEPAGTALGLTPGGSAVVTRTVTTATVPPRPDVVLLADTTGSMQAALNDVRVNAKRIVDDISGVQPDARFAVAEFRDEGDEFVFRLNRDLTAVPSEVQEAVNVWTADGGGDDPEAGLNALYAVATGAVTLRTESSPIVVIFGDAPSHDPSVGHDLAGTIQALTARGVRVVAVDVGNPGSYSLDQSGQYTEITRQTGGVLFNAAGPSEVSNAILAGIRAIQSTVGARVTDCDPQLSASVTPAERTVDSGGAVDLTVTVAVDPAARNGEYACRLEVSVDGLVQGEPERLSVTVSGAAPDVPVLYSDAAALDLGEAPLGVPSSARTVTLTNTGDYPLTVAAALAEQPLPAVFAVTGSTCAGVLAVARSCALALTATPRAIGAATSVLSLASATDTGGVAAQSLALTVSGRSPTLQFNPGVGRPGQVVTALGQGFPAGAEVLVGWVDGAGTVTAVADASGRFAVPMVVFEEGLAGPRAALASVPSVGQVTSGTFLVQSATGQPGPFTRRR
ncbi:choice-of-anchor D domain-containing protein [Micromonospora rifamycinica]|uniref:von Willebrand factor type A domain-containing protein n=1 Tax=Micromonospora rifamycinica TaxID=291594 RepID=A0A1C5J1P7_9ACTN|nr:choice-of-anchor D domain-containing protein [Micromonospora rifamycinica]SCG64490.1 von Willebrand factor type A domain-containing protein [Micromonospora rifamycinica]